MCAGSKGSYSSGSEGGAAPEVEAGQVRLAAGEHQAHLGLLGWGGLKLGKAGICKAGRCKAGHCGYSRY